MTTASPLAVSLLIVDDHCIFRQGLRLLLGQVATFHVCAEAGDGETAVRLARELSTDVVIMDVNLPGVDGITATRQIISHRPATKIIGLSGHADRDAAGEMLRAGACAYLLKAAAVDELAAAVHAAVRGGARVSPPLLGMAVSDYMGELPARSPLVTKLSPRESEVLRLVADGLSTKQVAHRLSVSVKTIETHRRNLMGKLQIDHVAGLTKYAIRQGLCSL